MNIETIRRLNVLTVINSKCAGSTAVFAKKITRTPSEITRRLNVSTNKDARNFGPTFRKVIEKVFELPPNWLDEPHPNLWDNFGLQYEKTELPKLSKASPELHEDNFYTLVKIWGELDQNARRELLRAAQALKLIHTNKNLF